MTDAQAPGEGATDVAALSASVLTVSLSIYITQGEFEVFNIIVSFTLLSIIYGYIWPNKRKEAKSFALAAIIALGAVPGFGLIDEGIRSNFPLEFLSSSYQWQCSGPFHDPCKDGGDHLSRVSNFDIALAWMIVFFAAFGADRRSQARRP